VPAPDPTEFIKQVLKPLALRTGANDETPWLLQVLLVCQFKLRLVGRILWHWNGNVIPCDQRQALFALAARYGATNVRVFGSTVRGEETPESDVDFLVDMPIGASLYDLIEMTMEIETLLERRADVVTERGLNPLLRERILAEAKPL